MTYRLSEIRKASAYTVKQIHGDQVTRILEMGITPGSALEYIRRAPTGYPLEIRVRGYLLTLRKAEAESIEVSEADL